MSVPSSELAPPPTPSPSSECVPPIGTKGGGGGQFGRLERKPGTLSTHVFCGLNSGRRSATTTFKKLTDNYFTNFWIVLYLYNVQVHDCALYNQERQKGSKIVFLLLILIRVSLTRFIFFGGLLVSTVIFRKNALIFVCFHVGLAMEFRSEKIPRSRLGMDSVIPRKKVLIPRVFRGTFLAPFLKFVAAAFCCEVFPVCIIQK